MKHVQLILTEGIHNLGETGDLVRVKPGYAHNFLLPQGKAILATDSRVKELEHNRKIVADHLAKQLDDLQASKVALEKLSLEVEARAGEQGRLFGSVTSAQIAELLAGKGFEIDRRRIEVDPVKSVGEHQVSVKLHRDVVASVSLTVTAEGVEAADPLDEIVDPDDLPAPEDAHGDDQEEEEEQEL